MSKSLKNFITIRQTLEQFTPNQVRMCFLLHKWNTTMNYSDGAMEEARAKEKLFNEFFHNVKAALRNHSPDASEKWTEREIALNAEYIKCRDAVYVSSILGYPYQTCLCDDFDTEGAMNALEGLVKAYNRYVDGITAIVAPLVTTCAGYISSMFRVFGLIDPEVRIGFNKGGDSVDEETVLTPIINILSDFRGKSIISLFILFIVRAARADPKEILRLCDEVVIKNDDDFVVER